MGDRQIIMLVDDNPASLTMGKNILKEKYDTFTVPSGEKLFEILAEVTPDLILLDVSMPEMDGYTVIRRLKAARETQDIPVVFLSSRDDPGNELEGLSLGAIDYISKPFSPALLLQRIDNHLLLDSRKKKLENYNTRLGEMAGEYDAQSRELLFQALAALAEAAEFRGSLPGGHNRRIPAYIKILLHELDARGLYTKEAAAFDRHFLFPASALHDIGKLFVADSLLSKESPLSGGEFAEIKKHPEHGVSLINSFAAGSGNHVFPEYARVIAATHHERWDGKGYPAGLKETGIPLLGRLAALADGYDALVSERPYRKAMSTAAAEKVIVEGKGAWLDPVLVDIFKDTAGRFAEIAGKRIEN